MTAEPVGHVVWAPDPAKQNNAGHPIEDRRIELNPERLFVHDPVDGRFGQAADPAAEPLPTRPFEVRLPMRELGS